MKAKEGQEGHLPLKRGQTTVFGRVDQEQTVDENRGLSPVTPTHFAKSSPSVESTASCADGAMRPSRLTRRDRSTARI